MAKNRYLNFYVSEIREYIDELNALLVAAEQHADVQTHLFDDILRICHTCKSSSSLMELTKLTELFLELEELFDTANQNLVLDRPTSDLAFRASDWVLKSLESIEQTGEELTILPIIDQLRAWNAGDTSTVAAEAAAPHSISLDLPAITDIRVRTQSLDMLLDLTSELSQLHLELVQTAQHKESEAFHPLLQHMGTVVSLLKEQVLQSRLVSVDQVFGRLPHLVRELAHQQHKEIMFSSFTSLTHIDKGLAERMRGPLLHLIRNAVDHGIEMPAQRTAAGKPAEGKITLRLERTHQDLRILVEDDGHPFDLAELKKVAANRGLSGQWLDDVTEETIIDLISHPHFSTKQAVSTLSGRGVGLSSVRSTVESYGGSLHLHQTAEGKRFELLIPSQLSLVDVLIVDVDGVLYAIPHPYVTRTVQIEPNQLQPGTPFGTLKISDGTIPAIRMAQLLRSASTAVRDDAQIALSSVAAVVHIGERDIALIANRLLSSNAIMIKPSPNKVMERPFIAGSALLPSGTPVHLLDLPGLTALLAKTS